MSCARPALKGMLRCARPLNMENVPLPPRCARCGRVLSSRAHAVRLLYLCYRPCSGSLALLVLTRATFICGERARPVPLTAPVHCSCRFAWANLAQWFFHHIGALAFDCSTTRCMDRNCIATVTRTRCLAFWQPSPCQIVSMWAAPLKVRQTQLTASVKQAHLDHPAPTAPLATT